VSNRRGSARESLAILVDLDKELVGRPVQFLERGLHGAVCGVLDFPDTIPGVTGYRGDHIRYTVASFEASQVINVDIDPRCRDLGSLRLFDDNSS